MNCGIRRLNQSMSKITNCSKRNIKLKVHRVCITFAKLEFNAVPTGIQHLSGATQTYKQNLKFIYTSVREQVYTLISLFV